MDIECTKCNKTKPREAFSTRTYRPKGIGSWCLECFRAYHKVWYGKNKSRKQEAQLKSKYGLSLEDYDNLCGTEPKCAICGYELIKSTFNGSIAKDKIVHIDHCHTTGKVRGILCSKCNTGLGMFRDDIAILKRAAAYLEKLD